MAYPREPATARGCGASCSVTRDGRRTATVQQTYAVGIVRLGTLLTTTLVWGMLDAGDIIEAFYKNVETGLRVKDATFGPVEEGFPKRPKSR